jgi:hypothetical protein
MRVELDRDWTAQTRSGRLFLEKRKGVQRNCCPWLARYAILIFGPNYFFGTRELNLGILFFLVFTKQELYQLLLLLFVRSLATLSRSNLRTPSTFGHHSGDVGVEGRQLLYSIGAGRFFLFDFCVTQHRFNI